MGVQGLLSWFAGVTKTECTRTYDVVYLDLMAVLHSCWDAAFLESIETHLRLGSDPPRLWLAPIPLCVTRDSAPKRW